MMTSDDNIFIVVPPPQPMPGTLVSVRVNPDLLKKAQSVAKRRGATIQELVRESLRAMVEREQLSAIYGSQKGRIVGLSQEQRDAVIREYVTKHVK